jgi:hypothetical protein
MTSLAVREVTASAGDVLARYTLRRDEFAASVQLACDLIEKHSGPTEFTTQLPAAGGPRSGIGIVEGWRGTIVHRVEINAAAMFTRSKIVDPSWFNWPARPVAGPTPSSRTSRWPTRASTCPTPATTYDPQHQRPPAEVLAGLVCGFRLRSCSLRRRKPRGERRRDPTSHICRCYHRRVPISVHLWGDSALTPTPAPRTQESAMSNDAGRPRPNIGQYVAYCYGKALPASMRDWVRNDLGGKGATVRTMIGFIIPAVVVLAPFWLIPTTV